MRLFHVIAKSSLIASIAILSSGCSGPSEDVRIRFCKELTVEMLGKPQSIDWIASNTSAERLGDLVVKLDYAILQDGIAPSSGKVACTYEQDEGSDFTMGDANPLEAYKTLPYQVSLNGRSLNQQKLNNATKETLLSKGKEFAQAIRREADKAVKKLSDEVNKITNMK